MTPTLHTVLDSWFSSRASDIHTSLVARVKTYDAAKQTVDCEPINTQNETTETGTQAVRLPLLVNVPVCFPASGGFRITFPIQENDFVLVVFSENSLDAWQAGGNESGDTRRFNLSDGVAFVGAHPNTQAHTGALTDAVTIGKNDAPQIVIRSNEILIGGHAGDPTATHAVMLGDTYRNAEDQNLLNVSNAITAVVAKIGVAATALTAAATANATPIVGGALASPGFAAVVAQLGLIASDLATITTSIATFTSGSTTYLSQTVKTK